MTAEEFKAYHNVDAYFAKEMERAESTESLCRATRLRTGALAV